MSTENEIKTAKAVAKAEEAQDDKIVLSTGVVLRAKKANTLVLIDVMAAFPRPKPPLWTHPTMGREMENPDDPDYLERVKAWQMEYSSATLTAFILLGTEIVSVPKGFPKPESDKWLDEYKLLNLPVRPNDQKWRYLKWVNFKAVSDENDLKLIQEKVGRLSGISNSSVQAAEEFPGSD